MKLFKHLTVLILLLTFGVAQIQAQRFTKKKRYWSLGLSLNASNYFGDIVPKEQITSFDIKFTKPQLGFSAQRRLTPNISFRAQLAYGALKGDDYTSVLGDKKGNADAGAIASAMQDENAKYRLYRNLHFRNSFVELSGSFLIDFKQNRGYFYQRPEGITPYAMVGIGVIYHNPQARLPGDGAAKWEKLRPLQTEGEKYSPLAIVIPMGIGLKYKVSSKIDIAIEAGYRWTTTDRLDDVSGRYYQGHEEGSLAATMASRTVEETSAFTGGDRTVIIGEMAANYGLVDSSAAYLAMSPSDQEAVQGVIASIFNNPMERRGNDGSPIDKPDGKKLGLFSGATDVYMVYGIHLNYILGGGVKCPKFR